MRNKIFSIIIPSLLILSIFIVFSKQNKDSYIERKSLVTNNSFEHTKYFDGSFQKKFNDLLIDQIPFKNEIIKSYYNTKIFLYKPFKANNIKYNEDVISLDGEYYIKNIPEYNEEKYNLTLKRGYNINELASMCPNQKFYVYKPTRIEETSLLDTKSIHSYGDKYTTDFILQLKDNVTYKELKLNSINEYKKLFYKTDIHWNAYGAYKGYSDIINMLKVDFPFIDDPKPIIKEMIFDEKFHGATANKIAQITKPESIIDLEIDNIGKHKYYVNGILTDDKSKVNYINNKYNKKYSDYDNYFGDNSYERIYKFDNDSNLNVLMFVDSFINVNKEWLASHFNTTVLLDLRALKNEYDFDPLTSFKAVVNKFMLESNSSSENLIDLRVYKIRDDFDIQIYLDEYDIDIVVVSQYYDNLFYNGFNFIPIVYK